MRANKGFSIVELSLAIAVSGMVLLAFMNVMQYMKLMETKVRNRTDSKISQTIGERFLWMGLKNAAPSFNNIPVADDSGKNFYDLNRDISSGTLSASALTRTLTLSLAAGAQTTFLALLSESTVANVNSGYPEVMFLDPVKFYNITDNISPASVSLNWNQFGRYVAAVNPNFFGKSTQVLEIYVPSTLRNTGDPVTVMPNSTSYFLRCSNVVGDTCGTENFGGLVTFKNATNTSVPITSFDNYLKTIPSASGGIPPILARVVRLVKYEIKHRTINPYGSENGVEIGDFYYSTWTGSAFTEPILIADRVKTITFKRPDITDPTITIDLVSQSADSRVGTQ